MKIQSKPAVEDYVLLQARNHLLLHLILMLKALRELSLPVHMSFHLMLRPFALMDLHKERMQEQAWMQL